MDIQSRLELPEMKDLIRDVIGKAATHSPLHGLEEPYLYSILEVTVPVGEIQYKTVSFRRKAVAQTGEDMVNEEQGAVQYFSNLIMFILRAADSIEEEVYADDDETYDVVVGKSLININRDRLGMPRIYSTGSDIRIDITRDE